jgi:quercetin dioxygenase-like cupin family protein
MPTFYLTGLDPDGRSRVISRRAYASDSDYFVAHTHEQAIPSLADGSRSEAELRAAPTLPGGSVYNIYPWRAGERTPMHRTITVDFDAVLQGSVLLHLDAETIEMTVGDTVLLPGVAHAWEAGPNGAVMLYNLVSAAPTGGDVGKATIPLI